MEREIHYAYFLFDLNVHVVDFKYPQGICLPNFLVEDFSGLFALPSIFF